MATDPTTDSMSAAAAAFAHIRDVPADDGEGMTETDAINAIVDRISAAKSTSPMRPILEQLLDEAAAALPAGHIPTAEVHLWFKDNASMSGALRRHEKQSGVYILGVGMLDGNKRPVPDIVMEIFVHVTDIIRVAVQRKVAQPLIVGVGGPSKIFSPQG